MTIAATIEEVLECWHDPPTNEANTCSWIIEPLLLAAGYQRRDISLWEKDQGNQFPDYTILPRSEHTWFLEAKSWTVDLKDSHVQQALGYASQNERRWVVLSNGREWRLYDNAIQGADVEKLIACSDLKERNQLQSMLAALSKESLVSGELDRFIGRVAPQTNSTAKGPGAPSAGSLAVGHGLPAANPPLAVRLKSAGIVTVTALSTDALFRHVLRWRNKFDFYEVKSRSGASRPDTVVSDVGAPEEAVCFPDRHRANIAARELLNFRTGQSPNQRTWKNSGGAESSPWCRKPTPNPALKNCH